jgi:2-haloacid dehalogenase
VRVQAVFFDLFGTLLPLDPLDELCDRLAPGRGADVAIRWRTRQIEATWLRTIMDRWEDFDVVTIDALRSTLDEFDIRADDATVAAAARAFAQLPVNPAATAAVDQLRAAGMSVGILTNASRTTLDSVVDRLGGRFDHALSVDAVRRFKPDPAVYRLAVDATGAPPEQIGFVTANGWDAAGAATFGLRVEWLRPTARTVMPSVGAPAAPTASWSEVPNALLSPAASTSPL